MQDPRHYIDEIRANLRKLQSQGQVTASENALFGMIDGLAGLQLTSLERITRLEQELADLTAQRTRPLPLADTSPGTTIVSS